MNESKRAMSPDQLEAISLPKWPALLVIGKRIELDDAAVAIVRCQDFFLYGNCQDFIKNALSVAGVEADELGYPRYPSSGLEEARSKYGCLELDYLSLSGRVISSWVGGAHGWLNWSGDVFTSNYNIGKWPDATEVLEEWTAIAEAFPDLDLTCQLMSGETVEAADEGYHPLVEYRVHGGLAEARQPGPMLTYPSPIDYAAGFLNPNREIGTTIERWVRALDLAEKAPRPYRFSTVT